MEIENIERRNKIMEMYRQGKTMAAIGQEFGLSRQRVHQIITHPPVERRRKYRKSYKNKFEKLQKLTDRLNKELAAIMSNYNESETEHNQDK